MTQQSIHLQETIDAPIDTVFARFADHEWFAGLFGGRCERIVDGEGEPNGLGSVRRLGAGPAAFEETIVEFEPNAKIHYRITRGGPLRNHLGELHFTERGDQTHVDYRIRFEGKLPLVGFAVKKALQTAWRLNSAKQLRTL